MAHNEWVIADSETGGVNVLQDRIVQFVISLADEDGTVTDTWEWILNPGVPIADEAAAIHGFSNEFLAEHGEDPKRVLEEIVEVFESYQDRTWSLYNLAFDMSILNAELERHGVRSGWVQGMADRVQFFDALVVDRAKDKYRKGKRKLENVAAHYGIPFDPKAAHNAKYDVEVTAKVAAAVAKRYGIPSNAEQAEMYRTWAVGLEEYLRRSDPDANVDGNWPLKLKEEA